MDLIRSHDVEARQVTSLSSALRVDKQKQQLSFFVERSTPHATVLLDFEKPEFINSAKYEGAPQVLMDIAWSNDGKSFYRVHGLKHENHGTIKEYFFPLIEAKFLQIHLYQEGGFIHKNEIRQFHLGFRSQAKFKASAEFDRLWVAANLADRRNDYGWASPVREKNESDTIDIDLGASFFVREINLKSVSDEYNFFPNAFELQLSEDNAVWQTVASEDKFLAAPGSWHAWSFSAVKARYVRVQIEKQAHYKKGEYQSKIIDIAVLAEPESVYAFSKENKNPARMASENISGSVLLAANNISAPNRVVQSNDVRLRNATTEYRGIMQFARDNEAAQEKAVQGNDSRLRMATEASPGIVQLAKDGEDRENAVVQGSDARIKHATQDSYGIVQLAKEGEAKSGVVVQASDARLKPASTESFGIVSLARDGENAAGKAVQGNDSRLRAATQSWPGIIQLAQHGEIAGTKGVAADDPRLAEGSESHKGRVQFARKGEIADLKAVQSSDPRLHAATEENMGVVQFSRSGVSVGGRAVQANDSRLSDAREAKPHHHAEYAMHGHELNSHTGNLHIKCANNTPDVNLVSAPIDPKIPLNVENTNGTSAVFSGAVVFSAEGVASTHIAKTAPAIQASSREAAAAVLVSANSFALHVPRSFAGLNGSGLAIRAEGKVEVDGQLLVKNSPCIAVSLPKASNEAFVEGDLVTIENGVAAKMRSENQTFVGVVTKNAAIELEASTAAIKVSVAGIVPLRVFGQVKAGDKLVLNPSQPGTCKVGQGQEKVFAVALDTSTNDREKQVLAILTK